MRIENIFGWSGAIALLICYLLSSMGAWSSSSSKYKSLNLLGSIFLLLNAVLLKIYPFVFVNFLWAIVSFSSFFKKQKD
ncbi:MAG: hypothetical protein JST86_09500 [Bacteroidetes bacterium]|nr:hypothetical protein [Bacteroidota bacterium]